MADQGQGVAGIGLFLAAFVDEHGAIVRRNELGKVSWRDTGEVGLGKGAAAGQEDAEDKAE